MSSCTMLGYQCTNELLDGGSRFTAIGCANDLIAFGAIKSIQEHGLDVPKGISLTEYDDIILASFFTPKLADDDTPGFLPARKRRFERAVAVHIWHAQGKIMRSVDPELMIRETARKLQE